MTFDPIYHLFSTVSIMYASFLAHAEVVLFYSRIVLRMRYV